MEAMTAVFWKVREISERTMSPRPKLAVQEIANELLSINQMVVPSLDKLKMMRLIEFNKVQQPFVRLTLLGTSVVRRDD